MNETSRNKGSKLNLRLRLIGEDGNAFNILGIAKRAMVRAKVSSELQKQYHAEATSGDYNKLLQVTMEYFYVF